ncbi:MAG: AAA family ATPase [Solirubrobacterales bacterium]|nr:AAA family ATPase [Solirubrobacterales bacterium]
MRGAVTAVRPLVVETKLGRPALRPELVMRGELIARMVGSSSPLVAVSAPVGYGKTTLVAQYAEVSERPVAWVSLDAADDDPGLLLVEIAMALDRIAPVEPQVLRRLAGAGERLEAMLPELVTLLGAYADLVLVLDDVHLVRSPASVALISSLSEHLPRGAQVHPDLARGAAGSVGTSARARVAGRAGSRRARTRPF